MMDCTIPVAKTKALIIFAVIAKQICGFYAKAKFRFSHDAAHMINANINEKLVQ